MQEHQQTLRIEHSWHWKAYIFHTQATMLQNTPAHPIPFPAPGPAVFPSLPPSLCVFEPFFTSVAGHWQPYSSDKIHEYTQENLLEKRCVIKTEAQARRVLSSCSQPILRPISVSGKPTMMLVASHFVIAVNFVKNLHVCLWHPECHVNTGGPLPGWILLRWQGIPRAVTGAD